jgi:hypothetical protein
MIRLSLFDTKCYRHFREEGIFFAKVSSRIKAKRPSRRTLSLAILKHLNESLKRRLSSDILRKIW